MVVDLLKMSKILVDFLSFFEKSVEFFAPNTDWANQSVFGAKNSTDFSKKPEKIHQDFAHF